jgi:hypothetical protein
MTTWTLRQSPHPRDRRLPTATGPVALVRRALMRWRWRWADGSRGAGSLGAARGRGADPIRVFRAPIGTASTHRATLGSKTLERLLTLVSIHKLLVGNHATFDEMAMIRSVLQAHGFILQRPAHPIAVPMSYGSPLV